MPELIIRQMVTDYVSWRRLFDLDRPTRHACGSLHSQVFRNPTDPESVLVRFIWDDLERARLYFDADDLQTDLAREPLFPSPEIWIAEASDNPEEEP